MVDADVRSSDKADRQHSASDRRADARLAILEHDDVRRFDGQLRRRMKKQVRMRLAARDLGCAEHVRERVTKPKHVETRVDPFSRRRRGDASFHHAQRAYVVAQPRHFAQVCAKAFERATCQVDADTRVDRTTRYRTDFDDDVVEALSDKHAHHRFGRHRHAELRDHLGEHLIRDQLAVDNDAVEVEDDERVHGSSFLTYVRSVHYPDRAST
jgi:hypothetical protein